jgi:hypothetical protein
MIERFKESYSYDPETGIITRRKNLGSYKAGGSLGSVNSMGYLLMRFEGKSHKIHRLAWAIQTGEFPDGEVDHINGIKTDNRFINLRVVTKQVNQQNRHGPQSNSTTGFLGVAQYGRKFTATIKIDKKTTYIGVFETPELAYEAYLCAKRIHHVGCTI